MTETVSGILKRPQPVADIQAAKRQRSFRQRSAPRASQACHACATSKTRCDDHSTCDRCRKRNIPCIRNYQLPNSDEDSDDQVAAGSEPSTNSKSPKTVRALPTKAGDDVTAASQPNTTQNNFDGVVSTPCSADPSGGNFISHTSQSFVHDITEQLLDPGLVTPTWNFDTSFDLFELDNKLDWGLNAPEVDFLSSLELPPSNDTIFSAPDVRTALASPAASPDADESSYSVQQAFSNAIGQWTPDSGHYRARGEKEMVSKDLMSLKMNVLGLWDPFISIEPLAPRTRDKLVAMAVASCEPSNINSVVSAFPAVDVLDRLINISLTQQKAQIDGYIHVPTFQKAESRVELLAAVVTNGTLGSSSKAVQKFGHGLGEILACVLHQRAERDYSLTRDLQYLQAFCLSLQDALWSGIKNKMELAGSLLGVLTNMLRVGGRFRRATYTPIIPTAGDVGDVLHDKWRNWVAQESFKRMVYHIQIHGVQESFMNSTAGSHLSSSELSLPLPELRELWLAPSAIHWKQIFLRLQSGGQCRLPSVVECIADPSKARRLPEVCDPEFTSLAQLYTIASLVRSFKTTQSLFATKDPSLNTVTLIADESQQRRLTQIIHTLGVGYTMCESQEAAAWNLLCELISMHLHISFDQLELFVGREGPQETRSAYPILSSWLQSQSSRHAVWHAGQVLRHMRAIPPGNLHTFYALACYHAGLCLCIYGFLSKFSAASRPTSAEPSLTETEIILLDGEETLATQRWTLLDIGVPAIARSSSTSDTSTNLHGTITLNSTNATMFVVIEIVRKKFQQRSAASPLLVENICRLMHSIGKMDQVGPCDSNETRTR